MGMWRCAAERIHVRSCDVIPARSRRCPSMSQEVRKEAKIRAFNGGAKRADTFSEEYSELIAAMSTQFRTLVTSSNCHCANILDIDGLRRLVQEIVKLDRWPARTIRPL